MKHLHGVVISKGVACGAVLSLGILMSGCDRPQPQPIAEEMQPPQTRPAPSETQEQAPIQPSPEREVPAWQPGPDE